ncbi:MAG: nucleotide exchange factor GrpE [Prevotella sp.]
MTEKELNKEKESRPEAGMPTNDESNDTEAVNQADNNAAEDDAAVDDKTTSHDENVAGIKDEEPQQDPLEKALSDIEELKTQMLYKQAEFDNFRKRTMKEKAELILNGGEKTVKAILPVLDDFERAMTQAEKTDDVAAIKEGMVLIYKKFMKILEGQGVQKIDTNDAEFNTDFHEAVALVPGMGDDKKGRVIDCVQTGYTLNDKVIRHAKVAVGQ